MSGSGPIYEYQRELTAELEQIIRERDEARAEAAHFKAQLREAAEGRLEARAEVERLRVGEECHVARPGEGTYECNPNDPCPACELRVTRAEIARLEALFQQTHKVADAQRATCLKAFATWLREVQEAQPEGRNIRLDALAECVEDGEVAVPLVTEEKP